MVKDIFAQESLLRTVYRQQSHDSGMGMLQTNFVDRWHQDHCVSAGIEGNLAKSGFARLEDIDEDQIEPLHTG